MVYSRIIDNKRYSFGISGRLYKSNVLLYDHQSESLWSQLMQTAVTGPMAGKRLTPIAASQMEWRQWKRVHPQTKVLSDKTGYARNYEMDPYSSYHSDADSYLLAGQVRTELAPKSRVLGIEINGAAKAYPLALLQRTKALTDHIDDQPIRIDISPEGQVMSVRGNAGQPLPHTTVYWFAWQAFHPQTQVYKK